MCPGVATGRWVTALIGSLLMLLAAPAASALGAAQVRFVHAVPGAGAVQLEARAKGGTRAVGGPVGFGEIGSYSRVPSGAVRFELGSGRDLSPTRARLRNGGHYTVVGLGGRIDGLRVLRDARAQAGAARVRVVQAAPELGDVEVRLGDARVAALSALGDVAGYRAVDPGAYAIRITRPDDAGTLTARGGVPLTAGTSSTAFVTGSAGEPLQIVVATDRAAAPRRAPATGLGGLSPGGPSLLMALLAGLLAAAGGVATYFVVTGRSRDRGV